MATLQSLVIKLADRLQDADQVLILDKQQAALAEALTDYQRFRPRGLIGDLVGNGTNLYTLPSGWVQDFSRILSLEFPQGEDPPRYLEEGDYGLYQSTSSLYQLRLTTHVPTASQTIRVSFTGPHSTTSTASTIPSPDEEAVVNKAASIACTWLAAYYAQQGQSSIGADVTNHESKSRQYRDLAKSYQMAYAAHLGIDGDQGQAAVLAASAIIDWDSTYPWGEDRLTHPRRWF